MILVCGAESVFAFENIGAHASGGGAQAPLGRVVFKGKYCAAEQTVDG